MPEGSNLWCLRYVFEPRFWQFLKFQPILGKEVVELFLRWIVHELFKDPFKVSKRIVPVTAYLFDEGVDHGTAPACFVAADEEPVLRSEFGGTNGVFGVVVIELDLAVVKTGFEVWELVVGVVERFPKLAFGKDAAFGF